MTNKEILDIAMQQSAYDTNAKASDFLMDTNVFVKSGIGPLITTFSLFLGLHIKQSKRNFGI